VPILFCTIQGDRPRCRCASRTDKTDRRCPNIGQAVDVSTGETLLQSSTKSTLCAQSYDRARFVRSCTGNRNGRSCAQHCWLASAAAVQQQPINLWPAQCYPANSVWCIPSECACRASPARTSIAPVFILRAFDCAECSELLPWLCNFISIDR
jgi:hypothetical protein